MGENFQDTPTISEPTSDGSFPLTDTDRKILAMTDEEYEKHDWEGLKEIIATNNLSALKRKPSDLRRYIDWTASAKRTHGSVTAFLLTQRLPKAWDSPPFEPVSQVPFKHPSDYKVLRNDWPYGFVDGITHLVVWSRTLIPADDETGDLTSESRDLVDGFVKRFFVERLMKEGFGREEAEDRVLWFKNWVGLQSVRSLEHVHVLVRGVGEDVIEEWTREEAWHRLEN